MRHMVNLPHPKTKGPLRKKGPSLGATLTGLEPATSAVTGRHANQLRYRAMLLNCIGRSDPNGIRTRATAVKGRRPRPLNDGAERTQTRESYVMLTKRIK